MKKRVLALLALVASLFALALPMQAHALSGQEFQAGNIIEDTVFFNKDTMSAGQIQQFLNSRVPVCDTQGAAPSHGTTVAERGRQNGNLPPYTCLRDYRQDTVAKPAEEGLCKGYPVANQSAAEIIYGVAQSCGINPQALIVLLQKEQGLIDDTSPWPYQYRSATGYGCPDTAPCDAEFYGFFNQVYSAARQFKRYALHPEDFSYRAGRNNVIQINPSASCGVTSVYIENNATAGLYNYTPYPPNQAALNNLYGEGDSCSAYGNRNFWRTFNAWFGDTHSSVTKVPIVPAPSLSSMLIPSSTSVPSTVSLPAPTPVPASVVQLPLPADIIRGPLLVGLRLF